jgi:hypothetical protein
MEDRRRHVTMTGIHFQHSHRRPICWEQVRGVRRNEKQMMQHSRLDAAQARHFSMIDWVFEGLSMRNLTATGTPLRQDEPENSQATSRGGL